MEISPPRLSLRAPPHRTAPPSVIPLNLISLRNGRRLPLHPARTRHFFARYYVHAPPPRRPPPSTASAARRVSRIHRVPRLTRPPRAASPATAAHSDSRVRRAPRLTRLAPRRISRVHRAQRLPRPPRAASTARRVSRLRRAPHLTRPPRAASPASAARRVSRALPRFRHGVNELQPHPARPRPRPPPPPPFPSFYPLRSPVRPLTLTHSSLGGAGCGDGRSRCRPYQWTASAGAPALTVRAVINSPPCYRLLRAAA